MEDAWILDTIHLCSFNNTYAFRAGQLRRANKEGEQDGQAGKGKKSKVCAVEGKREILLALICLFGLTLRKIWMHTSAQ